MWKGGDGDDAREREEIDLQPLLSSGHLTVVAPINDEEILTYIDLTAELGDGESMTAALAIHRGYTVVTDDRKAIRILDERGVVVRSTLELVQSWATDAGIHHAALRQVLLDVRRRGSYEPRRTHPLRPWWDRILDIEG